MPPGIASRSGIMTEYGSADIAVLWFCARKILKLCQKALQFGVSGNRDLTPQPVEDMVAPFSEIHDVRRQPLWMQRQAQHIDGRCKQIGITYQRQQRRDGPIG